MSHRVPTSAAPRSASTPRVRNPATDLRTASVGSPCFTRYHKHTTAFLQWLRRLHGPPAPFFLRLPLLAGRLEAYIQHLWSSNAPRSHASDTVFGLCFFFPLCRDALAGPKRLLKGWDILEPSQRRPPLPFGIVQLLAARWAAQGRHDLGVAALLGFECYFRPSELCGVLLSDITWDRSVRNDKIFIGAIALRQTKTGANMEVLLRANHTTILLREYIAIRTRQPDASAKTARLFTFNADHFRTQLQQALTDMGLAHLHFTPHCLRHGGATRDRKLGLDMQEIQDRGRWVQLKPCQRYVQIWSSLAIQMHLPDHIAALLLKLRLDATVTTDAFVTLFKMALKRASLPSMPRATSALPYSRSLRQPSHT